MSSAILTILSVTNQRIDQLHVSLFSLMDGLIAEVKKESDDCIVEIHDNLMFLQTVVKGL